MSVFITGKSLYCSLGSSLEIIITKMREKTTAIEMTPINLSSIVYLRPYYFIQGDAALTLDTEYFFYSVLFEAVAKALTDAGLSQEDLSNTGIFLGSTSIDISIYENHYKEKANRGILSKKSPGYGFIADKIASRFGITGPCYTFTTACTSSANGLMYASLMIAAGEIDRAIVVGYDFFNNLGLYGFEALKLLAPDQCRPFDINRNGIILGEGCGVVVLESEPKTGDDFYFLGADNCCDPFSVSAHDPEGGAIADLIKNVLKKSGLDKDDLTAIKAHGTASENNDRAEGNGMKKVFGHRMPPVTCLKPYVGHTVGASGVVELVLFSEAVKQGFMPATLNFAETDDEIGIVPITNELAISEGIFLLNYFGFGGNCTSLVISNRKG